jgi:uncharacterized protein with HEPN domain
MTRSDLERLHDAHEFAHQALYHATGLPADVLAEAMQPQHAALYALAIVGEALGGVSKELRSAAPEIPWDALRGLRNHVIHAYWQIDLEIIAEVIENRIDPLMSELKRLIAVLERADQ